VPSKKRKPSKAKRDLPLDKILREAVELRERSVELVRRLHALEETIRKSHEKADQLHD
jgi:hypothetical protein